MKYLIVCSTPLVCTDHTQLSAAFCAKLQAAPAAVRNQFQVEGSGCVRQFFELGQAYVADGAAALRAASGALAREQGLYADAAFVVAQASPPAADDATASADDDNKAYVVPDACLRILQEEYTTGGYDGFCWRMYVGDDETDFLERLRNVRPEWRKKIQVVLGEHLHGDCRRVGATAVNEWRLSKEDVLKLLLW